nr:hypothetical protein [Myxococcus xanthus]
MTVTPQGLYCVPGGFHVDPWRPVDRALITHAHGDHARSGSHRYLGARAGKGLLHRRLGADAAIDTLDYGERLRINGVTVSFHPAGDVLGSAQLRVEYGGETWVVSGDYKRAPDPTCAPFEREPHRRHVLLGASASAGAPAAGAHHHAGVAVRPAHA